MDLPESIDIPAGDLLADIDVQRDERQADRFTLNISPAWNVFYTFGGVTMAAALRAAQRGLDRDDLEPLAAHAVFCAPVAAGPVEVDVDVLRSGRTAANVTADLRQVGHGGTDLRVLATFGRLHDSTIGYEGIEFPADIAAPADAPTRPDPADLPDDRNPFPPINFHEQTEWRPAVEGWSWEEGWLQGQAREATFSSWFRLLKDARLPDGTIDPVSYCVPADMVGPAIGRMVGPMSDDNPPFLILSLDISLQFFARTESEWILQHVVSQWAGDGYGFGTTELWDESRRLVGMASQRARLRPYTPGEALGPK